MKQFNLDEYLKNPSRKVVTRESRNVRIKGYDAKGSYPVIGLLDYGVSERPALFTENGKYWGETDSSLDLYFAPEKHEGWANIYLCDGEYSLDDVIYSSRIDAEESGKKFEDYLTTIQIEWEE